MVGRRGQEEIKRDILKLLANSNQYSINYICKKINSNWMTVNEALDDLRKEGKISEKAVGRIKSYSLENTDTYFKLPVEYKEKKLCWYIYDKIIQRWKDGKNEIPNQLIMQKILTDVSEELKLPILKGWYLYGEISLVIPLQEIKGEKFPEKEYPKINENELNRYLDKSITEYGRCKDIKEVIEKHYKRAPKFWRLKREIADILAYHRDTSKTNELNRLLSNFLFYYPTEKDNEEITKQIYDFVILIGKIILINKFSELEINQEIKITFEKLWELVVFYNFFNQILNLFKSRQIKYNEEAVKEYFIDNLNVKKTDFSLMLGLLKAKYDCAITNGNIKVEDIGLKNKEIAFSFSNLE